MPHSRSHKLHHLEWSSAHTPISSTGSRPQRAEGSCREEGVCRVGKEGAKGEEGCGGGRGANGGGAPGVYLPCGLQSTPSRAAARGCSGAWEGRRTARCRIPYCTSSLAALHADVGRTARRRWPPSRLRSRAMTVKRGGRAPAGSAPSTIHGVAVTCGG